MCFRAINGEAALVISAEKLPKDSRYARIMQVMRNPAEKTPHSPAGDKPARFIRRPPNRRRDSVDRSGDPLRFLTVLVVATPCPC